MKFEASNPTGSRDQSLPRRPGQKAWLALFLALLVPACGKSPTNTGPTITAISPQGAGVARQVIVYIDWDRALNPSTWPTSFQLLDNLGTPVTVAVSFDATTYEISMKPTGGALKGGVIYTVVILDTLTGTDGTTFSGASFQFTTQAVTTTPPNGGQPTFSGITKAAPPTPPPTVTQTLVLTWAPASDLPDNDSIVYDVYVSTSLQGEDFAGAPFTTTSSGTGITLNNLVSGLTYYFIVRARESTTGNIDFNTNEVSGTPN